jgi:hypothetical protein
MINPLAKSAMLWIRNNLLRIRPGSYFLVGFGYYMNFF